MLIHFQPLLKRYAHPSVRVHFIYCKAEHIGFRRVILKGWKKSERADCDGFRLNICYLFNKACVRVSPSLNRNNRVKPEPDFPAKVFEPFCGHKPGSNWRGLLLIFFRNPFSIDGPAHNHLRRGRDFEQLRDVC